MTDDDSIDFQFGEWICSCRIQKKISLREAAELTGIGQLRLESLESGLAKKGITKKETELLASLYQTDAQLITRRALGIKT